MTLQRRFAVIMMLLLRYVSAGTVNRFYIETKLAMSLV